MRTTEEIIRDNKNEIVKTRKLPRTFSEHFLTGVIPSDTCGACYTVFSEREFEQAKKDNICLCDNCRMEIIVNDAAKNWDTVR